MTIGERIRNRRKELNMTQEDLGKKMNITKSAICKVERDKEQNLTTDRVEAFAKALACTESFLMGWADVPSENLFPSDNLFPGTQDAIDAAKRQKKIDKLTKDELKLVDDLIDTLLKSHGE